MPDASNSREIALMLATRLHVDRFAAVAQRAGLDGANADVRRSATVFYDWLTGPATLRLRATVRDADHHQTPPVRKGGAVQLRIADPQGRPYAVDLTVELFDARGNPIPDDPNTTTDDLAWTVEVGEGVTTNAVSGDTRTFTATATTIGSTVIRVSIAELSATDAIDVIAGDVAEVRIVEGAPRVVEPA